MHARPARARSNAPGWYFRHGKTYLPNQAFDETVLAGGHRVEVRMLEALQIAGRHGGVKIQLFIWRGERSLVTCTVRRQGLAHTRPLTRRLRHALGAGQHLGQQLVGDLRIAEEDVEHLPKDGTILLTTDQNGLQRPAYIEFTFDTHHLQRLLRHRNARSIYRHAGTTERTAKGAQVAGQLSCPSIAKYGLAGASAPRRGGNQVDHIKSGLVRVPLR